MLAGVACWSVIYVMLPKPMWVYVFGHELTHAVWTWMFGGKVKKFKATAKGGHVVVSKTNSVFTLAPYSFPIYAVGVAACFIIIKLFWDFREYAVWFHLLVGAAYAFHVTLTWHVLKMRQNDISQAGYLLSAVLIWLGNILVLLVSIPLLTGQVGVLTAISWCWIETGKVLQQIARWF